MIRWPPTCRRALLMAAFLTSGGGACTERSETDRMYRRQAERQPDLDALCENLLRCRNCRFELRDPGNPSESEHWVVRGCDRTANVEAHCGGFMTHSCAWFQNGALVLTHPD